MPTSPHGTPFRAWSPFRTALVALLASSAVIYSCQDATEPAGPGNAVPTPAAPAVVDPGKITLSYVCGTRFAVRNENLEEVVVTYQVDGTTEQGDLTLPPPPAGSAFSETLFSTQAVGTVQLLYQGGVIQTVANGGTPCPPDNATVGQWTPAFDWPIVAVHLHLLPTGKVLSYGLGGQPYLWDPESNAFTVKPSDTELFCSGHAFLPDGRLLVVGGHIDSDRGLPDVNAFNPVTEAWEELPPMHQGRWYPTATVMGNGEVVVIGGADENEDDVLVPEVWNGTTWRRLTTASMNVHYYPRMFLSAANKLYYAGNLPRTRFLTTTGTGSWKYSVRTKYNLDRTYGSAVMYEYGKILIMGGNRAPPTNTAEVIDLRVTPLAWRFTSPMQYARRQLNAVVLPDGKVLALGGTSGSGFNDLSAAVLAAEMWDPATEDWTTMASASVPRAYHSTALLMPDGRVLYAGSGDFSTAPDERSAELYSPPYLFRGPRPSITSAPSSVGYNSVAFVATPDGNSITKVSWIRLGSVTHAFDENQRYITMAFTKVAGGINVKTNKGRNALPPGHYMMFLLNADGVPSVARIIRIQ